MSDVKWTKGKVLIGDHIELTATEDGASIMVGNGENEWHSMHSHLSDHDDAVEHVEFIAKALLRLKGSGATSAPAATAEQLDSQWTGMGRDAMKRMLDDSRYRDAIREIKGLVGLEDGSTLAELVGRVNDRLGYDLEKELDAIAVACGCPRWDYPGQLVRDVEALAKERDKLLRDVEEHRLGGDTARAERNEAFERCNYLIVQLNDAQVRGSTRSETPQQIQSRLDDETNREVLRQLRGIVQLGGDTTLGALVGRVEDLAGMRGSKSSYPGQIKGLEGKLDDSLGRLEDVGAALGISAGSAVSLLEEIIPKIETLKDEVERLKGEIETLTNQRNEAQFEARSHASAIQAVFGATGGVLPGSPHVIDEVKALADERRECQQRYERSLDRLQAVGSALGLKEQDASGLLRLIIPRVGQLLERAGNAEAAGVPRGASWQALVAERDTCERLYREQETMITGLKEILREAIHNAGGTTNNVEHPHHFARDLCGHVHRLRNERDQLMEAAAVMLADAETSPLEDIAEALGIGLLEGGGDLLDEILAEIKRLKAPRSGAATLQGILDRYRRAADLGNGATDGDRIAHLREVRAERDKLKKAVQGQDPVVEVLVVQLKAAHSLIGQLMLSASAEVVRQGGEAMRIDKDGPVSMGPSRCLRETDDAIQVLVMDLPVWIPKAALHWSSEVTGNIKREGRLAVKRWFASKRGWS